MGGVEAAEVGEGGGNESAADDNDNDNEKGCMERAASEEVADGDGDNREREGEDAADACGAAADVAESVASADLCAFCVCLLVGVWSNEADGVEACFLLWVFLGVWNGPLASVLCSAACSSFFCSTCSCFCCGVASAA